MLGLHTTAGPPFNGVRGSRGPRSSRSGQVLIEFAFVALAFYFLLAGTVEMGRALHGSQALQNAARVCARELSVMPMPATITFEIALSQAPATTPAEEDAAARVRREIYDAGRLVLDVGGLSGTDYEDLLATLPLVNRMLVPLMLRERITIAGSERDVLRYPGAIFENPNYDSMNPEPGELGYYVKIPRISARASDGAETIDFVEVLSEIRHSAGDGPFSIASTSPHKGLVAVRMYYPFQAATMSAYALDSNQVLEANDGSVVVTGGESPVGFTSSSINAYSGLYGLGSQEAMTKQVRPFRRLLSAQSIFRREVFQ